MPLLAAAFAIVLVAVGPLLRALTRRRTGVVGRSQRGTVPNGARPIAEPSSELEVAIRQPKLGTATHSSLVPAEEEQALETPEIAEEPALAAVTAISSRRRESPPSRLVASQTSGREANQLQIVRRIEQKGGGTSRRARQEGAQTPPKPSSGSGDPGQFRVLGARIHLAQPQAIDSRGTLLVELELFVEGDRRRLETGVIGSGEPFRVSVEDLEKSVRALVVPDYLPALAEALGRGGLDIGFEELEKLTFAIELSIEVERAMAGRGEAFPIAG